MNYNSLTARESECLKLFVQGFNNKQVANILFISVKTVEKHRHAIYYKWGVCSEISMIRVAVRESQSMLQMFLNSREGENTRREPPNPSCANNPNENHTPVRRLLNTH